jgi:nucleoside-diphosphate-sugar epimerase
MFTNQPGEGGIVFDRELPDFLDEIIIKGKRDVHIHIIRDSLITCNPTLLTSYTTMAAWFLDILILGCGFTGRRVAQRFLDRGARVTVTTRDPRKLAGLGATVIETQDLAAHVRPGMRVVHSIPPDGSSGLLEILGSAPARVVYLSSTAVYGAAPFVNETTPVDWTSERARSRLEVEESILAKNWSALVLRPAAIYGPGRGAHESLQRGQYNTSETFVSRIHVEDLAAHVEAALRSDLRGAYPVADEEPCTSREIAEFCAKLLNLPKSVLDECSTSPPARFSNNRRVDGSAIRRALGITLKYPSYRVGIPASLRG